MGNNSTSNCRFQFNWSLSTPKIGSVMRGAEEMSNRESPLKESYFQKGPYFLFENKVMNVNKEYRKYSISSTCLVVYVLTEDGYRYLFFGVGDRIYPSGTTRTNYYKFIYEIGRGFHPTQMKLVLRSLMRNNLSWIRVLNGRTSYVRVRESYIKADVRLYPVIFYREAVRKGIVDPVDVEGENHISDTHYDLSKERHKELKENLARTFEPRKFNSINGDLTDYGTLPHNVGFLFALIDSRADLNWIQPFPGNHDYLAHCGNFSIDPFKIQMFKFFFFGTIVIDSKLKEYPLKVYDVIRLPIGRRYTLLYIVTMKYRAGTASGTCNIDCVRRKIAKEYDQGYDVVIAMHHGPFQRDCSDLVCHREFQRMLKERRSQVCVKRLYYGHTHEGDEMRTIGEIDVYNTDAYFKFDQDESVRVKRIRY